VVGADRVAVAVARALGDDHDRVAAAGGAARAQALAQEPLPVVHVGRALRNQHRARAGGDRAHESEVAAVAAHHLDHERALVAGGRGGDRVDRLGDAVQRRVGADRDVGARHVVVDRARQADDAEGDRLGGGLALHLAGGDQLFDERGPLLAQRRSAAQAAVAADHDQAVDTRRQEVARGLQTAVARAEALGARGPDGGAAVVEDAAHRGPGHRDDPVASVHGALVALFMPGASPPLVRTPIVRRGLGFVIASP